MVMQAILRRFLIHATARMECVGLQPDYLLFPCDFDILDALLQ